MNEERLMVIKIGGSVLSDVYSYPRIVDKIEGLFLNEEKIPFIVVSAMKGLTDVLLDVSKGDIKMLNQIEQLYMDAAIQIGGSGTLSRVQKELFLLRKIAVDNNVSLDIREDLILSFGERISKILLAEAMRQKDLPVLELDACNTIVTNAVHGNARISYEKTHKNLVRIKEEVLRNNTIPVIEGFIGCSDNGEITTLGRGGSDYTATTIAALLAIKNVYLFTDVDGVYSADPKLVSSPIIVRSMDYSEGVEAAKYGVKRFNAKMFEPLIKYYPSTIYVGNESRFGTKIQKASNVNGSKPKIIAYKNLYNRSLIAIIGNNVDRAKLIHKASSALSEVNVSFTAAVLPPASPSVVLLFNDKLDAQTINTLHDALIGSE